MSRYKWLPRGAPKKPDEFVSAVDHALRIVLSHKITIFSLVILIMVGAGAAWFYSQKIKKDRFEFRRELVAARESSDPVEPLSALLKRFPSGNTAGQVHLELLAYYYQKGDLAPALLEIDSAMKTVPTFLQGPLIVSKAKLLWQMGKGAEAIKLLDGAVSSATLETKSDLESVKAKILESMGKKEAKESP